MFLRNTYQLLLGFLSLSFKRIVKPKTLKDNIWGSILAIILVLILILYFEKGSNLILINLN